MIDEQPNDEFNNEDEPVDIMALRKKRLADLTDDYEYRLYIEFDDGETPTLTINKEIYEEFPKRILENPDGMLILNYTTSAGQEKISINPHRIKTFRMTKHYKS